jgi:hypothetical protein
MYNGPPMYVYVLFTDYGVLLAEDVRWSPRVRTILKIKAYVWQPKRMSSQKGGNLGFVSRLFK